MTTQPSTFSEVVPPLRGRYDLNGFHVLLTAATLVMGTLFPISLFGQQEWEKDGGIPSAEIQIIKDRQITLPPADRNFDKIPPRPIEPVTPEIVYQFKNLRFNTPDFNPAIRPLKLKQEDISKVYGNYLSAGYGNYASPYVEAYFNSKRNKNQFYGAHFYHHSFGNGPVGNKNSASGTTEMNLFGKAMSNSVMANGTIAYENRSTYFYGYPPGTEPNRDAIAQHYTTVSLGAGIENAKPSDLTYSLQGSYSHLSDQYRAQESELGLLFKGVYKISEDSRFNLNSDYFLIDRKDSRPGLKPRNLFRVKPAYQFTPVDKLWLTLGANVAYENDTIGRNKSFHAYPHVRADYSLSESVAAYAVLTGDIDKVSLHTLSRENLWINSNIAIFHTNRSVELLSGLKGNLGKKVAFGAGVSLANLKNLYFYQNAATDRAKFDVIYDQGNTQRIDLFAELGYTHGETVKMVLRGDYFHYSTTYVPYRPTYRLAFNSSYSLYSKLLFNIDFLAQGGIKALDAQARKTVTLDPALDMNVRIDYFVSKKISAFLKFNNLLSSSYQVYLYYPVRGFQVMGGVAWSF
jgi:hypothetical protein